MQSQLPQSLRLLDAFTQGISLADVLASVTSSLSLLLLTALIIFLMTDRLLMKRMYRRYRAMGGTLPRRSFCHYQRRYHRNGD